MRRPWPVWMVPTAVLLAGAVLTTVRLGQPAAPVFDEVYYVPDAVSVLTAGVERGFAVHPPVGKWLMAAGIALVGDTPLGWRIAGAVAGTLTAVVTTLLVRCLTGRDGLAGLAGLLVLLDGVFLVQARTAMLDVHLALFVTVGVWLVVVDRRRVTARSVHHGRGRRWPLALAGAAFGLAVATKWSGALALVATGLLVWAWEMAAARRRGTPVPRAVASGLARPALLLGLLPALVYALTWTPWLVHHPRAVGGDRAVAEDAAVGAGPLGRVAELVRYHREVARFHLTLESDHPYRAPATTWPLQLRPVVYHHERCVGDGGDPVGDGRVEGGGDGACARPGTTVEIRAVGNFALWWPGAALLPVLAAAVGRRDGRGGVPLALWAGSFLAWLAVSRPVYSFYAVPLVPFLASGLALACDDLDRPARRRAGLVLAAVGAGAGGILAAVLGPAAPSAPPAAGISTGALTGALLGGLLGGVVDSRRPPPTGDTPPVGTRLAVVVALLALALFAYFVPIWIGIPLPDAAIRRRWWLPSF